MVKLEQLDIIAIVPARGGSKRLTNKNVLPLAGKPLLKWTLDAAIASGAIDLIAITSDDDKVLAIARDSGVEAIARPAALATDTATTVDAIIHAIETLAVSGKRSKRVMVLQPTSPLRSAEDIRTAASNHKLDSHRSMISICEVDHPTAWCGRLSDEGRLVGVDFSSCRSQDLEAEYRINGAIYLIDTDVLLSCRSLFGGDTKAFNTYLMPRERSVDVDELIDFRLCEVLIDEA
jgi:N-acylneuraminate cytidylyltransferase/CMP-N,N'-diacetyllegionaminic acid synthase